MVAGSILQDNCEPFLTSLCWLVGYSIDGEEWNAINNDLLDGGGGSYELVGNRSVTVTLAIDRNSDLLTVMVEGPTELEPQVELAVAIFRHFQLRKARK